MGSDPVRDALTVDGDVAVATVVSSKRSAPRPLGSRMTVDTSGAVAGAVSGGCVEGAVIEIAESVLAGQPSTLASFGFADEEAWDVGLPCGGEIEVLVERYDDPLARELDEIAARGGRAALLTELNDVDSGAPAVRGRLLITADGQARGSLSDGVATEGLRLRAEELLWSGRSGIVEANAARVFVRVVAPPPRVFIVGAIDYAQAVTEAVRLIGWQPFVIDPRTRFATDERFPAAAQVVVAWPQQAFGQLGGVDRSTFVLALTHDPKIDDEALAAALRSDAAYIGAMGSHRAQADRRVRLQALGFSDVEIDRVSAPAGLDLGAAQAGETAVSMVSEMVAVQHGRPGGRLRDAPGRIHVTEDAAQKDLTR